MKRLFLVIIIIVTTSLITKISAQNEQIKDSNEIVETNPNLTMINAAREFAISFLSTSSESDMFDETIENYRFFSRRTKEGDGEDYYVFSFKDVNDSRSKHRVAILYDPDYPEEIYVTVNLSREATNAIQDGNRMAGVKARFNKNTGEFFKGDILTTARVLYVIKKFKEKYKELKQ